MVKIRKEFTVKAGSFFKTICAEETCRFIPTDHINGFSRLRSG